jgi:hypothetical protein
LNVSASLHGLVVAKQNGLLFLRAVSNEKTQVLRYIDFSSNKETNVEGWKKPKKQQLLIPIIQMGKEHRKLFGVI